MNILELAALAGQRIATKRENGGEASSAPASETSGNGRGHIDPDLLQIELALARFTANQARPEDFYMEGEG